MRVTQSLFAAWSWVIIAPLCFLRRVGTQGWLRDLVTHALATGELASLPTPVIKASEPPEAAQQAVLSPERIAHSPVITEARKGHGRVMESGLWTQGPTQLGALGESLLLCELQFCHL